MWYFPCGVPEIFPMALWLVFSLYFSFVLQTELCQLFCPIFDNFGLILIKLACNFQPACLFSFVWVFSGKLWQYLVFVSTKMVKLSRGQLRNLQFLWTLTGRDDPTSCEKYYLLVALNTTPGFGLHKHGWKCPQVFLKHFFFSKTSGFVPTNVTGDCLTFREQYLALVSTKTGVLEKIWFWSPQTWLEMECIPKKNIQILCPQKQLEIVLKSPGIFPLLVSTNTPGNVLRSA